MSKAIGSDVTALSIPPVQEIKTSIADKQVTYDLARLMAPRWMDPLSCSGFAEEIIELFSEKNQYSIKESKNIPQNQINSRMIANFKKNLN